MSNGKKVLFISEKRAAIDVVYSRLRQVDLHHLALAVNNPKKNKAEIINKLNNAFNQLSQPLERDAVLGVELKRWKLEENLEELSEYFHKTRVRETGFSLNELFL